MRGEGPFRRALDAVDAPAAMRRFILDELGSRARRWHGLLHHALMLRQIGRAQVTERERRRLIRAVLFHDIVYDATRADNEAASARVARDWLGDEDAVAALILATRAHDLTAADPVTRVLLEADLSVLWTPSPSLYAFYARGIRAEYAHVPDDAYRTGRAAVLNRLLGQVAAAVDAARVARLAANLAWEREELASGRLDRVAVSVASR